MPTNIKPFRDVNEHDVINFYKHVSGTALKGQFVKIVSGFINEDSNVEFAVDASASTFVNTVSPRWAVKSSVNGCTSGDLPIGMTLYDVKETDENGERLYYNPRKQHEMQAVLSGQAVPILTRGLILYSGVAGFVSPGASLYSAANGELSVSGTASHKVGYALGPKDAKGWVLIKIDL
jgi:hypothetical protein